MLNITIDFKGHIMQGKKVRIVRMKIVLYKLLMITLISSMYYIPSAFADSNANLLLKRAIEGCNIDDIKIALNQGADPQAHYNNSPTSRTYYEMAGVHFWDCFGNYRMRHEAGAFKAPNKTGPNKSSSHILEMYKLLIKHSENFDFKKESLPYSAIEDNWDTVIKYFLDNGANPNKLTEDGDYPVEIALRNKHNNIYDLLIEYGATPLNSNEINALKLLESIKANDKDKIEELISQGVNINIQTKGGKVPLYSAVEWYPMYSSFSTISYLLSKKADVNKDIYLKYSSFSLSFEMIHFQLLHRVMLRYDSIMNKKSIDKHIKLINLLIDNGADINGMNSNLQTPLFCAVIKNNIKGAEILLGKGAGVNIKDEDDNPPIAYSKSAEMSNLLRKHGAKESVRNEPKLHTIESYKKAIKIDPDNANNYVFLGFAYRKSDMYREAIESYKQAIKIDPNDATNYSLSGDAYIELGMYEEAIDACIQAIRIDPDFGAAHLILGVAYSESGMYKEAIKSYKQAIEINPNDAEAYHNLGNAYLKSDIYREAIESYKQAIKIDPNNAQVHYILGVLYSSQDRDFALGQYKILKKLGSELANKLFDKIYE